MRTIVVAIYLFPTVLAICALIGGIFSAKFSSGGLAALSALFLIFSIVSFLIVLFGTDVKMKG